MKIYGIEKKTEGSEGKETITRLDYSRQEFIIYIRERVSSSRYTLYKHPASSSYMCSFDHIFTFREILIMIKNC